jgi:hypothetical protein
MRIRKMTRARALGTPHRFSRLVLATTCRLQQRPQHQQALEQIKPQDYLVRRLVVLLTQYLAIPLLHPLVLQRPHRQHLHLRFHLAVLQRPRLGLLLRTLSVLVLVLVPVLALLVECSEAFWVNKVVDCSDKGKGSRRHQPPHRLGPAVKLHQRAIFLGIRQAQEAAVSLATSLQGLGRQPFRASISHQKLQMMRLPLL